MSPAAAAGLSRPLYEDGRNGSFRTAEGFTSSVQNGGQGQDRVLPHINDLLAAQPSVNPLAPIRRLLIEAENHAKLADTHLEFRRPEIALQEYIKASNIAVDIIPRHKEYPGLKADHGDLHRQYAGLQKRINSQHEKFERVKDIIQKNNARSGVRPASQSVTSLDPLLKGQISEAPRSQPVSLQVPITEEELGGTLQASQDDRSFDSNRSKPSLPLPLMQDALTTRRKPPVQPKPDALHGKIIKQDLSPSSALTSLEEDLLARFARLRGDDAHSPVQDPRIRTQPVGMSDAAGITTKKAAPPFAPPLGISNVQKEADRPLGPRDMPKPTSAPAKPRKILLDVGIPPMPKLPEAIYSPSRNFDNLSDMDLLRCAPRAPHGIAARSIAPSNGVMGNSPTIDNHSTTRQPLNGITQRKSNVPRLPDSATVTAEELMEYLQRGSRDLYILLVDIRDREDFDTGHIMSHSIICIEPVILREGLSAEELGQSLVLSPEAEQSLFEERDSFDIVVYYDQSSTSLDKVASVSSGEQSRLKDFSKAVYDYGYDKRLKRRPVLLVGGLDSWIDLVGPGALQTSKTTASTSIRDGLNIVRPYKKLPIARGTRRLLATRRAAYESRPLSKEEEVRWEEALKDEEASLNSADGMSYVRTPEDFLRRFPEPSAIQESMVNPSKFSASKGDKHRPLQMGNAAVDLSHEDDFDEIPQIPTRPAPAVPRQSYSGVFERSNVINASSAQATPSLFRPTETISRLAAVPGRAGLHNPRNHCYLNSVIQALSATPFLVHYMLNGGFRDAGRPPRKEGETSDPPQLMSRALSLVFHHLWNPRQGVIHPDAFKQYVNKIHTEAAAGVADDAFGGPDQQDSSEFLQFILQVLEDETNPARNKAQLKDLTSSQAEVRRKTPLIVSSWIEWQRFTHVHRSIIRQKFGGQCAITMTCEGCKERTFMWDRWLTFQVPISNEVSKEDLLTALDRWVNHQETVARDCAYCKHSQSRHTEKFSRLPETLVIVLGRVAFSGNRAQKITAKVAFPLDNLDLTPYFIDTGETSLEELEDGFRPPFLYQCYAVIQHRGDSVQSGHYWTLVRDEGKETWTKFNDSTVSQVPAKATQSEYSFILFFRRKPGEKP